MQALADLNADIDEINVTSPYIIVTTNDEDSLQQYTCTLYL